MDSWDFEEHLQNIHFQPRRNRYLNIWLDNNFKASHVEDGSLDGAGLAGYFSKVKTSDVGSRSGTESGLRLLYSYHDMSIECSDQTIYWSQTDFVKIVEKFQLPKRVAQVISRCHCGFSQVPLANSRVGFIYSTMFHHTPFWLLVASYDPATDITYALMHCSAMADERCIDRIAAYVKKMANMSHNPLLLPILIIDLETNLTMRDDQNYVRELGDIEDKTDDMAKADTDTLADLATRIMRANVFLSLIERESEGVLQQLYDIDKALRGIYCDEPQVELLNHVEFLRGQRQNLALRIRNSRQQLEIYSCAVSRQQQRQELVHMRHNN